MCDPLTAIAAAGSLLSAGGSLIEGQQAAQQKQELMDAQKQANDEWVAYQNRIHQEQTNAENAARQKATTAQQDTLAKLSPEAQTQTQTTEQQRLNSLYTQNNGSNADPNDPSSLLLSGEHTGDQTFMGSLTQSVNQATAQARKRIAALATAGSYGGSFGGLATQTPITFAQGGNDINLQNDIRQGDLKTYGVEQQVQPVNYGLGPGTDTTASIAKALGGVAGSLAGFAGPRAATAVGIKPF